MSYYKTSDNNYSCSKFIVSPTAGQGTHTTITAALASASSGDTIFIKPGTYTENITLVAGVNLESFISDASTPNVIILGNTTASYNGTVSICGVQFKTNGASCLTVSGSNTSILNISNCTMSCTDATGMSINAANFGIRIINSRFTTDSNNLIFAVTTVKGLDFRNSNLNAGTAANTIASGAVNIFNSKAQIFSITTSSTGSFNAYNSFLDNSAGNQTIFTTAGTGSCVISNCQLFSGSASAISIGAGTFITMTNDSVESSNTNAITGAGTLVNGGIAFTGTSKLINTTTQTAKTIDVGGISFDGGTNTLANWVSQTAWTPGISFGNGTTGITYTTQNGYYNRIGNMVFCSFEVTLSAKGSSTGIARLTGFPFTSAVSNMYQKVGYFLVGSLPGATTTVSILPTGVNFTILGTNSTTGAASNLDDTNFTDTSRVWGAIWYYTS